MIEIIALIFLTREIGRIAERKGLNKTKWKVITIISWIIAEIFGAIIGLMIFERDNLFSIAMVALLSAITSYFIIKSSLLKRPDIDYEDEINNIGNIN